jgi:hypothetical protein
LSFPVAKGDRLPVFWLQLGSILVNQNVSNSAHPFGYWDYVLLKATARKADWDFYSGVGE